MAQSPKPTIALYGALRSGTTLLRLMLDAHPQLSCPGETDFIFDYLPPGATFDTPYDRARLEENRIYRAHEAQFAETPLPEPTPDRFINRIRRQSDVAVLILHRGLGPMLGVYPDMPIIHLVRDPRDVARSSIGMGWAGDVYHGARHWIRTESDWQGMTSRMAPDQVLRVKYEELITRPEETLAAICAFAGVAWDPAMLTYDATSTYDKPDPSLTEQWRRKLSPREVGLVEGRIGPLLEQTGYVPSGVDPVVPLGLDKAGLVFRHRWAVWRERVRRYGWRDPLIVAVCRRLGLPGGAAARRRMGEAALRYLK